MCRLQSAAAAVGNELRTVDRNWLEGDASLLSRRACGNADPPARDKAAPGWPSRAVRWRGMTFSNQWVSLQRRAPTAAEYPSARTLTASDTTEDTAAVQVACCRHRLCRRRSRSVAAVFWCSIPESCGVVNPAVLGPRLCRYTGGLFCCGNGFDMVPQL